MNLSNLIAKGEFVDVYEDNGKAVKVFKADMPKNKQKAFNEAMVHATVEATGLPIPKVHGVCEVPEIEGAYAIVMDMAQGKTLAQLIKENPAKSDEYLNMMVDLQIDIQSHQVYHIGKLKDKLTRQINRLDDIGEVCKYELLARLAGMPKHTKLCHNNFSLDHIFVTDDGKVTVIDWVAAKQGNASADVAKTYLLLSLDHPDLADKYLNLFCEKTKTKKEYVTGWLPIVAAARLTEKVDREKALLLKWVDVANYE
ncbi:MAG: phosphotransferase [Oscillospiraceae bacterium]|nr:phosphotransferase [Oscillospiraceae bacterium]MDY2847059.1 phosphotransferase [Oscillospiraceae bacterium]